MKKVFIPMIRYGDKEFDEGFVGWGFQSYDEQVRDALGVLNIARRKSMKILDIACGLGNYHKVWLDAGHTVVGSDLSETFIFMATNNNPRATYRVENFYDLNEENEYDLITMFDTALEDEDVPRNAYRALKFGGRFIFQIQNPRFNSGERFLESRRNWQENEDRTFTLTRHEYNDDVDRWEYEEWHIDIENAEVVIQHNFSKNLSFCRAVDILMSVGFTSVSFLNHNGRPYIPEEELKEEPRYYFCVAFKGEYEQ